MELVTHPAYRQLVEKVQTSHEQGRRTDLISSADIDLARLYCYAFRNHTIGAFHATGLALGTRPLQDPAAQAHARRAREQLEDLADQGMEPVPDDFRVVLSSFHRYHRGVTRVIDALDRAGRASADTELGRLGERFAELMGQIAAGNGLYLTRDTEAPEQATFVVPNLGITIAPLVYGDHHSWNLAHLTPESLDVPMHRHRSGVEIHLGFPPLEGYMVWGECKAPVQEGYALPVPPMTRHGWVNTSGQLHHVPFIFGSLIQGGWGVFFDVEAQPRAPEELRTVERTSWQMGAPVFLAREIDAMARMRASQRRTLIPASVMDRRGSGGLELSVSRVSASGLSLPVDRFRIASVVRGSGVARVGGVEASVQAHDHFGIPAGMGATLRQQGAEPMVILDALIKGVGSGRP